MMLGGFGRVLPLTHRIRSRSRPAGPSALLKSPLRDETPFALLMGLIMPHRRHRHVSTHATTVSGMSSGGATRVCSGESIIS
jgi:hypothetical protein